MIDNSYYVDAIFRLSREGYSMMDIKYHFREKGVKDEQIKAIFDQYKVALKEKYKILTEVQTRC